MQLVWWEPKPNPSQSHPNPEPQRRNFAHIVMLRPHLATSQPHHVHRMSKAKEEESCRSGTIASKRRSRGACSRSSYVSMKIKVLGHKSTLSFASLLAISLSCAMLPTHPDSEFLICNLQKCPSCLSRFCHCPDSRSACLCWSRV